MSQGDSVNKYDKDGKDLSLVDMKEKKSDDIKRYPNKPTELKRAKSKDTVKKDEVVMTSIIDLGLSSDMLIFILSRLQFLQREIDKFNEQKRVFKLRHNKGAVQVADINIAIMNARIEEVRLISKMGARAEGLLVTKYLTSGDSMVVDYIDKSGKGYLKLDKKQSIDKSGTVDVVIEFVDKKSVDTFIKQVRDVKKYIGIEPPAEKDKDVR